MLGKHYAQKQPSLKSNRIQAEQWYKMAIKQDHVEARLGLAILFYDQKKYKKAVELLKEMGQAGDSIGYYNMGYLYRYKKTPLYNLTESYNWNSKAADMGNAKAINNLAGFYFHGKRREKNLSKAFNLYLQAAEKHVSTVQNTVVAMYYSGMGVKVNKKKQCIGIKHRQNKVM